MKKKNIFPVGVLFLFVVIVLSDKILSSSTTKDETSISFDVALNEGYVAFIANENEPQDPTPKPDPDPAKCPCKGTGNITHGDGHVTPCPYHKKDEEPKKCQCDTDNTYCDCINTYGKCNCVKRSSPNPKLSSNSSDDRVPVASAVVDPFPFLPDKQMVWFTASWCGPCQRFKGNEVPKLKDRGWRVSEDKNAHIKIIDVDKHSDLYEKYGDGRSLPTFILFVDKQEVASITGLPTANEVANMYNKETTD